MKSDISLKPKQINAIQLLALGTPDTLVAERLEITTMTLWRWKRLPQFDAKLRAITTSGLEEIAKMMNAATLTAVETLQETMCNLAEPASIRLKAALGILSHTASVNGMLEKGLKHRVGDFSLHERFERGSVFDSCGNRIVGEVSNECYVQLN